VKEWHDIRLSIELDDPIGFQEHAMAGEIKREDAGRITKKLLECRIHLRKDNVYSCLTGFRDVLEKTHATKMLPVDEKQLRQEINAFQAELAASRAFRHLYGPVTFKDDDIETALDFMKQLIQIKEEEIAEAMESRKNADALGENPDDLQLRIQKILLHVEKGDFDIARSLADKDEEAADALIEIYNTSGIQSRIAKDFDKAVATFKKALFVRPADEVLHYNMARAYIEAGDWKSAGHTIDEGLKNNPDFQEGIQLQSFIRKNLN
jgi:tetratricopeptide (TPR) repeat protein